VKKVSLIAAFLLNICSGKMMEDVNKKMAKGAFWMLLFKVMDRSVGLVSTIILARLLVPADFGLVVMATAIIGVLELLSAFNFDIALIHNRDAGREHFDTVWTLDAIMGCVYALLLCALAYPAAHFYNEPRLSDVMFWLALGQIMVGFENVGVVAFRKELQFALEFKLFMSKRLITFCITVTIALMLQSYWALVIGILAGRFSGLIITYLLHPYRPRFCLSKCNELFHFSKWLLLNNILFFFTNKFSNFVIGKMVGMSALGIFTVSYELANLPSTELVMPINRAIFPGYSKLSGDKSALRRSYLEVAGIIALFALPMGLGLIVVAKPLVLTILGQKWIEAIPLFQLLAINGIFNSLAGNLSPACIALGKPRILTLSTMYYVILLIPSMIIGAKFGGLFGSVIGMVVAHAVMTPVGWTMVLSQMEVKAKDLFAELWRPAIASFIMAMVVLEVLNLASQYTFLTLPFFQLCAGILLGAITYVLSLVMIWRLQGLPSGAEARVLNYALDELRERGLRCRLKFRCS